jgi:hypothetical protein
MTMIIHYDHITGTKSDQFPVIYARTVRDWCAGWPSNQTTLEDISSYRSQLRLTGRQADTRGSRELHEKAYIGVLITDAVLYVLYAQLSVNLRKDQPAQGAGTTPPYSMCTNAMFWYDTGLQY